MYLVTKMCGPDASVCCACSFSGEEGYCHDLPENGCGADDDDGDVLELMMMVLAFGAAGTDRAIMLKSCSNEQSHRD